MCLNTAGERIMRYLGTADTLGTAAQSVIVREIAFSFVSDDPVPGFYRGDRVSDHALTGPLP
jgi:hypothetical protein